MGSQSIGKIHKEVNSSGSAIRTTPRRKELIKELKRMDFGNWFLNIILPGKNIKTHKVQRNSICICGSGLKYKKCCYLKDK